MSVESSPEPEPAPSTLRRSVLALVTVVGLVALDLWSKHAIFEWLEMEPDLTSCHPNHERFRLLGDWFAFMLNENYGAAFGQFEGIPYLLVGLRCAAAVLLVWLIVRAPRGQRPYFVSLVLILAGAVGNLYDNLAGPIQPAEGRPFGPVRDFIDVYFTGFDWHFPTFNVADSCITVGAVLLLFGGMFGRAAAQAETEAEETPTAVANDDAA